MDLTTLIEEYVDTYARLYFDLDQGWAGDYRATLRKECHRKREALDEWLETNGHRKLEKGEVE